MKNTVSQGAFGKAQSQQEVVRLNAELDLRLERMGREWKEIQRLKQQNNQTLEATRTFLDRK